MKNRLLYFFTAGVVLLLFTGFELFYPTGAPAGYTGSPGDGQNCTACHGGTATTTAGLITSNIPPTGYVPGQTYQITATNTLTGSGKYGFEVSPQNAAGTLLGTLTAGANNQLVGSGKYVTHTNANITNNSWTFNWTAPAAGTGSVTFYGAFAKGKPGPVTLSTLAVSEAVTAPGAAGPITGPTQVCKNNTESYSIAPVAGATSYVWSVPSGASIVSGQGSTAISVNYSSSAASGNISVYGTNTAGSGAPSTLGITVNSVPSAPGSISGSATPCQGTTQVYSVTAVSGNSYTWVVPTGWTLVSGQGSASVQVIAGAGSGSIAVSASNTCGAGPASSLGVTPLALAGIPALPTGPDMVYYDQTPTSDYSTAGASGADSYEWSISPAAAGSISGTGLTATVTWAAWTGTAEIRVRALNTCGSSDWSEVKTTTVDHTTGIGTVSGGPEVLAIYRNSQAIPELLFSGFPSGVSFRVMDLAGNRVYQGLAQPEVAFRIDANLTAGLYLVVANAEGRPYVKKIVVR